MKAAVYYRYGNPDVVEIKSIPKPVPLANQYTLRVLYASVNRTDCGFRSAEYFISRFWSGLLKPKFHVLGCEFCGVVDEVGIEITKFKKGDRVFGYNDADFGAHAEYMLLSEKRAVALAPADVSSEHLAVATEGAHYALGNIRASGIRPGERALVYGATGAIGSAAVQLLKYFGVHVTAVCSSRHVEVVKDLNADVVVGYEKEDFTFFPANYKLAFDAVGKSSFALCKPLLAPDGVYISTELGKHAENVWLAIFGKVKGGKRVLFPLPTIRPEDVALLGDLVSKGIFKPLIDRRYSLDQIVEAYRYVETGMKLGNVLIEF